MLIDRQQQTLKQEKERTNIFVYCVEFLRWESAEMVSVTLMNWSVTYCYIGSFQSVLPTDS